MHPCLGDKKLRSIKIKTIDDYYHFLETEAEPATNMGKHEESRKPDKIKCLRLEGSNFRLGGIAPITRAIPSF